MRILVVFAIMALCSIKSFAQNQGAQNIGASFSTTRFVMFSGNYSVKGSDRETFSESGVFRIDTYTGDASWLKVEEKNGEKNFKWIPVQNPVSSQDSTLSDAGKKESETGFSKDGILFKARNEK
ncbi:MAG TPA: hypothetical protein PK821_07760 [Victivallales bacterium]|nr:hypothetical protein [Victivallales bacterium]